MSFSDTLGLVGIAVSVLFGIWGVYLAVRKVKYPASLTFVREQSVALLEDFAKKIPNLSVIYKDIPIDKSVVLLSGYVVNDGSLDITREMTEESLTCCLPADASWLEFKVTTSAPALHVQSIVIDSQNARLDFGLFRRNESFSFQALAVIGEAHAKVKASEFADKVCWKHRIASLGEVKTVQMPPQSKRSRRATWVRRIAYCLLCGFYFLMGLSQMTGLGPLGKQPAIIHKITKGNATATVKLVPNRDGTTTVKNLENGKSFDVDLASYAKSTVFLPIHTDKSDSSWGGILIGIITFITGIAFMYQGFSNDYRRRQIRKLVAASVRET